MSNRVWKMVRVTAVRESQRIDLALVRAIFVLVSGGCLFACSYMKLPVIGVIHYRYFFVCSTLLMLFLATRLSSDVVGSSGASWIDLLKMTGIRPRHWIGMRYVESGIAFGSVWIVRLPFLLLIYTFGGLRLHELLWGELLLCFSFWVLFTIGLLSAYSLKSRGTVMSCLFFVVLIIEVLPRLTNRILKDLPSGFRPNQIVYEWSDALLPLGLLPRFIAGINVSVDWTTLWLPVVFYSVISALFLLRLSRVLFRPSADRPQPQVADFQGGAVELMTPEESVRKSTRRERARCWDDALAWQAYQYHGGGRVARIGKWIVYPSLLFLYLCLLFNNWEREFHMFLIFASVLLLFVFSFIPVNNCLERETKERTLTMLMLTPHDNIDFYNGWRRGAWKSLIPALWLWGVTLGSGLLIFPQSTPFTLTFGLAVLVSGPFMMVCGLIPVSLRGLPAGALVVTALFLVLGFATVTGALMQSAWPAGIVGLPLLWGLNQLILKMMLPTWIDRKMYDSLEGN